MDAATWDERYRSSELVWGVRPNRWVEQELADMAPGRALDLACGEGRNALWLASLGWQVTAVDFSAVALDKGRKLEDQGRKLEDQGRKLEDQGRKLEQPVASTSPIDWVCADATQYRSAHPMDLVVICYLQVTADARRSCVRGAAQGLGPGGTLLVVGHDSTNIADGTGGPQDASVLFTADDLASDLDATGLIVDKATTVLRPVDGADRPAIDALLRARAPR